MALFQQAMQKLIQIEKYQFKTIFTMKETYVLRDILRFMQRQAQDNYAVIEAIVNLIEYQSENLSDSEKEIVILETLRKYGLFEIGYSGDRSFREKISPIPQPERKPEEDIVWEHDRLKAKLELYNIRLLNAVVEFRNFMN